MRELHKRLLALGDPVRAKHSLRFFKTGPGQYGEGDRFLGLTLPQIRAIAREFRDAPLAQLTELLDSEWHEERLVALIIAVNQFRRGDAATRRALYQWYLKKTDRINNWDLVDVSSYHIVGSYLCDRSRAPLRKLAKSKSLWERRIAIISTAAFIREGEVDDTLEIAKMLLSDKHDLIHKAVGWMLREVGKRDPKVLRAFLDEHATEMPRTALRYAIERFPPAVKAKYMRLRPAKRGEGGRRPDEGSTLTRARFARGPSPASGRRR